MADDSNKNIYGQVVRDIHGNPISVDFPTSSDATGQQCGTTGQDTNTTGYRPQSPHSNLTSDGKEITDSNAPTQTDCTKPDTPSSIKLQQTLFLNGGNPLTLESADLTEGTWLKIMQARESPDASNQIMNLAKTMTGGQGGGVSSSGYVPPATPAITGITGKPNTNALQQIQQLTQSMNNVVNFSSLQTPILRVFLAMISSIPGLQGLEQLPYFRPLSESIGASITFLTDMTGLTQTSWIANAASGLNVTTPISKLNRSKIHPGVLESVDKVFQDLNRSVEINLGQIFSQYAGFLSMFGNLLGFLPKEVTSILGPIIGTASQLLGPLKTLGSGGGGATNIIGNAAGFVGKIFGAYSQIAATAHGLDMIVDIIHHQRVLGQQTQMLNILSSKFGDQLRVLQNQFPIKGGVKVGNSIQQVDIHGYPALVNLLGDKIMYVHYTNEILNALKAVL